MNLFGNLGKAAQGAGATIGKAAQGAGQSISQGIGSLGNLFNSGGSNPSQSQVPGGLSGGINNVSQATQKAATSAAPSVQTSGGSPLNYFQSATKIQNPFQSASQGASGGMQSSGLKMPSASPLSAFQSTPQVAQQSGVTQALPQVTQQPQSSPTSSQPQGFMNNLFKPGGVFGQNPQQTMVGMGMSGIGQMFASTPKMPDLSQLPSYQAMKNVNFSTFQEMDPALATALNNDLKKLEDDEMTQLTNSYKNLRPGADIESDSKYKQDIQDLRDQQASRRTDLMAKARVQAIQAQIGANAQEMEKLKQLAAADTTQVMYQLGIDSQAAENFKQLFGSIGGTMTSAGFGLNQQKEGQNA